MRLRANRWYEHADTYDNKILKMQLYIVIMIRNYDNLYKVIVLGNNCTGKTTLCHYYANDFAPSHTESTIGIDFHSRIIHVKNKVFFTLKVKVFNDLAHLTSQKGYQYHL